jgi:hypothetical protein
MIIKYGMWSWILDPRVGKRKKGRLVEQLRKELDKVLELESSIVSTLIQF